jgi:hypothetical protein
MRREEKKEVEWNGRGIQKMIKKNQKFWIPRRICEPNLGWNYDNRQNR